MELNLGRSERLDVHHGLAFFAAQDDTLVVAERDAPDGLARVANLADGVIALIRDASKLECESTT